MSNFLRSLSCKGSSSISIRDQKEPSATFSLANMTKEEEEMPLADYFDKKGLGSKLKKFLTKLGRKKKGKRQVVEAKKPAAGEGQGAFFDEVNVEVENQVAGGGGTEEEIAPVGSTYSPMSTSPATPSASATPSPGRSPGSRRGRGPRFDSQGNRRPPKSEVGRKYFGC